MPTKTQIERAERHWRHFVFDSRFTRIVFFCGVLVFLSGMFTPHSTTEVLMKRVIPIWFGCFFLYFASAFALTTLNAFTRRSLLTGFWMAAWTFFIGGIGCVMLRFSFR